MAAARSINGSQRWWRTAAATIAVLLYAAVGTATQPRSPWANLAVLLPGAAVAWLVTAQPRPQSPERSRRLRTTLVLWATVALAAALWELWAFLNQPAWNVGSHDHPTISVLAGSYLAEPLIRYVAWCAWLFVGWRMVRR